MAEYVLLIGVCHDRRRVELTRTPPRILVGDVPYDQITDPDTGEFLGAYLLAGVPR